MVLELIISQAIPTSGDPVKAEWPKNDPIGAGDDWTRECLAVCVTTTAMQDVEYLSLWQRLHRSRVGSN